MRIIPAIDILGGKCVRLTKGNYNTKKVYSENPVEVARRFEDHGMLFLHLVDLDGARSNNIVNYKILEQIATQTRLTVDFGGGIKRDEDITTAFDYGAAQVNLGSIAVSNRTIVLDWLKKYGPDKIILGADCTERKIVTQGWTRYSELDVLDFIKEYERHGICYCVCTDTAKDGLLCGPSVDLYSEIKNYTQIKLIASGGVRSLSDLALLDAIGCEAAIVGKAIYEERITLKELSTLC